jgi:hypothetical protein
MGNQSSSEKRRGSSKKYSINSSSKNDPNEQNQRRQIVKSASCGTMIQMSQESNQQVCRGQQPSDPSLIIQCTSDLQLSHSPEETKHSSTNFVNGQANNRHHYNIHHPKELLGFKSLLGGSTASDRAIGNSTDNNIGSFGTRSHSALDFLASKSPLTGLIKARLGKGNCEGGPDVKKVGTPEDRKNILSPSNKSVSRRGNEDLLPPSNTKKMECNLEKFAKVRHSSESVLAV